MKLINLLFILSIIASSSFAQESNPKKPLIAASINPIYQILLAITKDKNNSILLIDSRLSEHDFQLKTSDVEAVNSADLVFYIDDSLEKNLAKLIKNNLLEKKSYELSKTNGIKLLQRRDNSGLIDPHIWLNPQNAIKIAEFMAEKISEIDEENREKYQENLQKFIAETNKTETTIRRKLARIKGSHYVFYHDGYQYFEDYFSLKPQEIFLQGSDNDLSVQSARAFDSLARQRKIKCLFSDVADERSAAIKLAQNYKIKFAVLDLIGAKNSAGFKGYSKILLSIAETMDACLLHG
jgi:zinc transport system substrate-binding protein